ncbi:hypothetical protein HXY32_05100 [Candidatus Bathyarchaeota archaeon]|nr:hypothetical protein [Candidatus Bathyarchaeota archaeon]
MKAKAVIHLKFPSKRYLRIVFKALKPEVVKHAAMRSVANLKQEDRFLVLTVEAKDTVALRAALNAYLRWVNSILTVLDVLKTQ